MVTYTGPSAGPTRSVAANLLLVANLAILLLPPVYLWFADGDIGSAFWYFIGAPAFCVLTMLVLGGIDDSTEAEGA